MSSDHEQHIDRQPRLWIKHGETEPLVPVYTMMDVERRESARMVRWLQESSVAATVHCGGRPLLLVQEGHDPDGQLWREVAIRGPERYPTWLRGDHFQMRVTRWVAGMAQPDMRCHDWEALEVPCSVTEHAAGHSVNALRLTLLLNSGARGVAVGCVVRPESNRVAERSCGQAGARGSRSCLICPVAGGAP